RPRCGSTNQQLNPQIYRTPDHENVSLDLTGSVTGGIVGTQSVVRHGLLVRKVNWIMTGLAGSHFGDLTSSHSVHPAISGLPIAIRLGRVTGVETIDSTQC
ncbi:hypothetical protein, partial [Micromonospora sp. NPDC023814]|uniref:hypothetical protein n=1 Tax=Micromonospora sp. NPDC023814 TaxID=3154596 RepID=UPI0033DF865B